MKMKAKEVQQNLVGLAKLHSKIFPVELSYAISANVEELQKEAERIEKERTKLCEQYAEKDEKGNPVMVDSILEGKTVKEYKMNEEKKRELKKEYETLLETEIEIKIRKVKTEVLSRCEASERYDLPSVAMIAGMSFMLE